ncbi:MAG: hypothetical protein A2744_03535 [Candidatus Buchananbacteria bacterium RIFCSPHIGHO2_01_FULL_44_11]|uniref:Uncharacterized protein n=1 Tax=Candidatus Buchananbacteria bacterium RIFCSPHIGHO2_01_FULL_44_11 TaxID=1797535 RepID=A0A1G1Y2H7_9BACT|nr:MAG: hypothetical protein A2744_03535 [Candidatus Buchananbacteria bacterium RIFCSPHIGHO2_01_FULL_44_11]
MGPIKITFLTILVLMVAGTAVWLKNKIRIIQYQTGQLSASATDLHWRKSLKHTLIMYLGPALILFMPFILAQKPNLIDVGQAAIAYLALNYLKNIYQ